MNAEGKSRPHELLPCPRCGMDSGERKTLESVNAYERFFVRCHTCGYITGGATQHAATRKWNDRASGVK